MGKLKYIIALLIISLSLSGCSTTASEAQATFENMMKAFQSCDKAQIDEYYSFDNLVSYIEEAEGELLSNAVFSTLSKMEYKVNSAERMNSNAVKLNVEITTVDFSEIMQSYITKVSKLVESPEYQARVRQMDDNEYKSLMVAQMIAAIDECGDKKVSKTIDVTMAKGTSGWLLGGNSDEFLGALFEDLSDAVEALV